MADVKISERGIFETSWPRTLSLLFKYFGGGVLVQMEKIFAHIIYKRVVHFLEKHKGLTNDQPAHN